MSARPPDGARAPPDDVHGLAGSALDHRRTPRARSRSTGDVQFEASLEDDNQSSEIGSRSPSIPSSSARETASRGDGTSVKDIIRAAGEEAIERARTSMSASARRDAEQASTLEAQHRRAVTYLASRPKEGPRLRARDRLDALIERFPTMRKVLERQPGIGRLLEDERGVAALAERITRGGEGLSELAQNYGGEELKTRTVEEMAEDLMMLERAKAEMREGAWEAGAQPGTSAPREPTAADDEAYLMSLERGGENEERPNVWTDVYLRAHAKMMDVMIPFMICIVGATLGAARVGLLGFIGSFTVISLLLLVVYRHARGYNTYNMNTRNVGTPAAMTVHAILLACALQFYFVYAPMFGAESPMTCFITAVAFIACPWLFYKTYTVGPGFVPTVANSFSAWSLEMERVGATMGGKTPAEKASQMMMNGRYCSTCHCARPLRSKHCPFCNRCVLKMDHHCPITMTCIGAKNQRLFLMSTLTMLIGQLGFLYFSAKYYGALVEFEAPRVGGSGFLPAVVTRYYVLHHAPFGMGLFGLQIVLTLYCFFIVARMALGIMANLTVNEMENAWRYDYLKSGDKDRPYRNVFDAGAWINCSMFWRNIDWKRDWDGFYVAAQDKRADLPIAPKYSYSWFHSTSSNVWSQIFRIHAVDSRGADAKPSRSRNRHMPNTNSGPALHANVHHHHHHPAHACEVQHDVV